MLRPSQLKHAKQATIHVRDVRTTIISCVKTDRLHETATTRVKIAKQRTSMHLTKLAEVQASVPAPRTVAITKLMAWSWNLVTDETSDERASCARPCSTPCIIGPINATFASFHQRSSHNQQYPCLRRKTLRQRQTSQQYAQAARDQDYCIPLRPWFFA